MTLPTSEFRQLGSEGARTKANLLGRENEAFTGDKCRGEPLIFCPCLVSRIQRQENEKAKAFDLIAFDNTVSVRYSHLRCMENQSIFSKT